MSETIFYIAHQRQSDKAVQSLESHLLEVSGIAKSLAAKIGLKDQGELIACFMTWASTAMNFRLT